MTARDTQLLVEIEQRAFRFFWETAQPETGFVPDRARADGSAPGDVASCAGCGFALTALAIAAENGWEKTSLLRARAELTLRSLLNLAEHERGFFFHFIGCADGKRRWSCEASSIDTALGVHGGLAAGAFFGGSVAELAQEIFRRIDWPWMSEPTKNGPLIRHGWKPESGFLEWSWDRFSEHFGMTRLAMSSPTHPLEKSAWRAWERTPWVEYAGRKFLHHPPLFVHQFPQAWIDWRGWKDPAASGLDYFENARQATLAQRQFCIDLQDRFPSFGENLWGLTSSDFPGGYADWGGPPIEAGKIDSRIDGSVVPCAVAGSLPFAPDECLAALHEMRGRFGDRVFGRYGFADAFHPLSRWTASDVLAIDQGITLLMAENLRTGLPWALGKRGCGDLLGSE